MGMGGEITAFVEVTFPFGAGRGFIGTEVLGEEGVGDVVFDRPDRGFGPFWFNYSG